MKKKAKVKWKREFLEILEHGQIRKNKENWKWDVRTSGDMLFYIIIVALSCCSRCFLKVNLKWESKSENRKWKWKWNVREITWARANRENKENKLGQSEAKDFHRRACQLLRVLLEAYYISARTSCRIFWFHLWT